MKKKIIITVIVLLVLGGLTTGGIFAYKQYQKENLVADVYSVASLNYGYWEEGMTSYGMLTNDMSQNVYLEDGQTIREVFVEEGQQVETGDKLVAFDITEAELNLEAKKLELQGIVNDIEAIKREIAELRNTTPIPERPVIPDVEEEPETQTEEVPENPVEDTEEEITEKEGNAYNYITKKAEYYNKKADGSEENPYRFLCTKNSFVYGSYLNYLKKHQYVAVFEIRKDNKKKGTLISAWTVNGAAMEEVDKESKWSVLSRQEIEEPVEEEPLEEEPEEPIEEESEEEEFYEYEEGYTAAELAEEIRTREAELKSLDLTKREAELNLKTYEDACEDGIVYATIDGVVKSIGDPQSPDGEPYMCIAGSEGLYVTGEVSELMLGEIEEGQQIMANSWDSGMSFMATITEISEYPSTGSDYYGEGNPNVSYYPYTAYIEDSTGLTNGEYVELTFAQDEPDYSDGEVLCLQLAYVREENGRPYVMVAGEDERLEKRYIVTGKQVWGDAVIIEEGLSESDRIAFPYGKMAKEGAKVQDAEPMYY